jgi:hypothetical protein
MAPQSPPHHEGKKIAKDDKGLNKNTTIGQDKPPSLPGLSLGIRRAHISSSTVHSHNINNIFFPEPSSIGPRTDTYSSSYHTLCPQRSHTVNQTFS